MSRQDEIRKLIDRYQSRLQKLKEQEATYGISVDPSISLEIEDIERKLVELRAQLNLKQVRIKQEVMIEPRVHPELRNFLLMLKKDGVPEKQILQIAQQIGDVAEEKFHVSVLTAFTKDEIAGINNIAKNQEEANIMIYQMYQRRTGGDPADVFDEMMSVVVNEYQEDYLEKKR